MDGIGVLLLVVGDETSRTVASTNRPRPPNLLVIKKLRHHSTSGTKNITK